MTHPPGLAGSGKYLPVESMQDALVFIVCFAAIIITLYVLIKYRRGG